MAETDETPARTASAAQTGSSMFDDAGYESSLSRSYACFNAGLTCRFSAHHGGMRSRSTEEDRQGYTTFIGNRGYTKISYLSHRRFPILINQPLYELIRLPPSKNVFPRPLLKLIDRRLIIRDVPLQLLARLTTHRTMTLFRTIALNISNVASCSSVFLTSRAHSRLETHTGETLRTRWTSRWTIVLTSGLPTGSSPEGIYKRLVAFHKKGELSFKYVITFNMDEYVDLPR